MASHRAFKALIECILKIHEDSHVYNSRPIVTKTEVHIYLVFRLAISLYQI